MTNTASRLHIPANVTDVADAAVVSRRLAKAGFAREIRDATRVRGYHVTRQEGFSARNDFRRGWVFVDGLPAERISEVVEALLGHGYKVQVHDSGTGVTVAGKYASAFAAETVA